MCSWIQLVRNSEVDTVGTALPCCMISGASAGMTQLTGPGKVGPEGSVSKMASSFPCLASRLVWLKNRTSPDCGLDHHMCPLQQGRFQEVFSKWSRSLVAFYNLASEVSCTSILVYKLKWSQTSPPGSRERNQPASLWEEYQRIHGHVFKPPHPASTPSLPSTTITKTVLNTAAGMTWSCWNEIKVSLLCSNPSLGTHFTQSKS